MWRAGDGVRYCAGDRAIWAGGEARWRALALPDWRRNAALGGELQRLPQCLQRRRQRGGPRRAPAMPDAQCHRRRRSSAPSRYPRRFDPRTFSTPKLGRVQSDHDRRTCRFPVDTRWGVVRASHLSGCGSSLSLSKASTLPGWGFSRYGAAVQSPNASAIRPQLSKGARVRLDPQDVAPSAPRARSIQVAARMR